VPFSWQKAIFAYLLQTGVTLWSNSVMWTHIDSLDSPYGFWMKLGLIGIIDLAGFWLVTLHLFGRAPLTRSYAIAAAILLMIVVLHQSYQTTASTPVTQSTQQGNPVTTGQYGQQEYNGQSQYSKN
jgi:hypothetical protein